MRSVCCVSVYPPTIVARQLLGKHVPATTNIHTTVKEDLLYQR
jgi:hypothetical protein